MLKRAAKNLIVFLFVFGLIGIGIFLYLAFRSDDQTESTSDINVAFGTLPNPIEPDDDLPQTITSQISTSIKTTSNKVYRIDTQHKYYPNLTFASSLAQDLDMKKEFEGQTVITYRNSTSKTSLDFNKSTHMITVNFSLEGSSVSTKLPSQGKAQILAQNKLVSMNLWPFEEDVKADFNYYKTFVNEFYLTNNTGEASLMKVSFTSFIDSLPKLSSDPHSGEISILIDTSSQIQRIQYMYRPIDRDKQATYPLNNVTTATTQLQQGYGEFITSYFFTDTETATLTDVTLGYRIEQTEQEYIQPVYFFEGHDAQDNPIFFLVPAINGRYLINITR